MKQTKINQKNIGRFLKKRRKFFKLTQKQLAEKCGLKHNHISNIESGAQISMNSFFKLCNSLSIEIEAVTEDFQQIKAS